MLWYFLSGISRGFFFYAGNIQFFLYGVIIEAVAYLYLAFKLKHRYRFLLSYLSSFMLTLGLALPLLVSEYLLIKNALRPIEGTITDGGIPFNALVSSFLPYPITKTHHPLHWGNPNWHFMSNMYHIGFVWMLCFFIGLVLYLKTKQGKFVPLVILGTLLLFLSAGWISIIYSLKAFIPLVGKMRVAFKFYPFCAFIILLYSTLVLTHLRKNLSLQKLTNGFLTLTILTTLYVGMFGTNTAHSIFSESPYPKLAPQLLHSLNQDDVICTYSPERYDGEPYVTFLQNNYSCLFNLMSVNIYDPLLPTKFSDPDLVTDFKKYFSDLGVTKVILHKVVVEPYWSWKMYIEGLKKFPALYEDNDFILFDINNPKWLLRQVGSLSQDAMYEIQKYTRSILKVKINSEEKSMWEYHNEYRNGYYVLINGKKAKMQESPASWCMFEVPEGENIIEIGYIPPGFLGSMLIGLCLMILSYLLFFRIIVFV